MRLTNESHGGKRMNWGTEKYNHRFQSRNNSEDSQKICYCNTNVVKVSEVNNFKEKKMGLEKIRWGTRTYTEDAYCGG